MKSRRSLLGLAALSAALLGPASASALQTVNRVDLDRYVGLWHEIARFPNSFQRDCGASTAFYTKRSDGKIDVTNACTRLSDGRATVAKGLARVRDTWTNAKLEVTFLPVFLRWLSAIGIGNGAYWVIDLGDNYEYAVVSEPSLKYLWILSRTPTMSREVYTRLLGRARAQGLDVSKLRLSTPDSVR